MTTNKMNGCIFTNLLTEAENLGQKLREIHFKFQVT